MKHSNSNAPRLANTASHHRYLDLIGPYGSGLDAGTLARHKATGRYVLVACNTYRGVDQGLARRRAAELEGDQS